MSIRTRLRALDQDFMAKNKERKSDGWKPEERYRVTYRFAGDRKGMEYVQKCPTVEDRQAFIDGHLKACGAIIVRVWEAV